MTCPESVHSDSDGATFGYTKLQCLLMGPKFYIKYHCDFKKRQIRLVMHSDHYTKSGNDTGTKGILVGRGVKESKGVRESKGLKDRKGIGIPNVRGRRVSAST